MNQVELKPEEAELLRQVLHKELTTLETEINHADYGDSKAFLKERRGQVNQLLDKLPELAAQRA